jgi:RNA polymerase sigma factor (sigma-70 family)
MSETSVLIAEDHHIVRRGICRLLADAGFRVVGEAADGREAVDLAAELQPDVILLDIGMPEKNGIEAAREIKKIDPQAKIVMLTMHESSEYLFQAIKAGALNYVLKDRTAEDLIDAVTAAAQGLSLLEPAMASRILREFAEHESKALEQYRMLNKLTEREKDILRLLVQGQSNKEIAKTLFVSDNTVRNHLSNIFEKLHANDRTAAAVFAVKQGLA